MARAELDVWKAVAAKATYLLVKTEFPNESEHDREQRAAEVLAMFVAHEEQQ